MNLFLALAVLAFVIGIWIGIGAPGWPHKDEGGRKHARKRPINPIAWGRTPGRERPSPRVMGERRIKLK